MIDTIHFRIHDLIKHAHIKNQLATSDKSGSTMAEVSKSTLESIEGDKVRVHLFHDRDNILPLIRRSNLIVPSSHYSVAYCINEMRDFIDFNISIPKYVWGTNVLQYIPYYDQSPAAMFNLLKSFFFNFFKTTLLTDPCLSDLEIVRLDMCYNQFFVDKQQALTYLESQKGLAVKYARSSKNNYRNHETSLFYVTRRYSFKIYHKGTEFAKNDRKELQKRFPAQLDKLSDGSTRDTNKHNINKLQYEADRTLRYEMTFRRPYFDYILKNDIVFKDNVRTTYHDIFNKMSRNDSKKASKVIEDFKSKTCNFMFKSEWDNVSSDLNKYVDNYNVTFNLDVFTRLHDRFWQKVKDYQLNIPMTPYDVITKINEHNKFTNIKNEYAPKKLKKSPKEQNRLLVLAMLSQYMDVENLKKYLPKSSFFRMKAELNKLGINMYNNNHNIPAPPFDYQEYKYIFGGKFNLTL